MDLECSFREVKHIERFIKTPYGEFSFSSMLSWLQGLIASCPSKPSVFISDPKFVRLVTKEGIAKKEKGSNYFFVVNMDKCNALLMSLRRAGMYTG